MHRKTLVFVANSLGLRHTTQPMDLPHSVQGALSKPRERTFLCLLEEQLLLLIHRLCEDKGALYIIQALVLCNSYYRLLGHQLCHHYSLQHWNNPKNDIVVTGSDWVDYTRVKNDVKDGKVALVRKAPAKPPTIIRKVESAIEPSAGSRVILKLLAGAQNTGRVAKEAYYRQKRDEIFLESGRDEMPVYRAPNVGKPLANQSNWPPQPNLQPNIVSGNSLAFYPYGFQPFYGTSGAYPMDLRTERKLLNNPYIIMPEDVDKGRRRRKQRDPAYSTYPGTAPYVYAGFPVYSGVSPYIPYSVPPGPGAANLGPPEGSLGPSYYMGAVRPPDRQSEEVHLPPGTEETFNETSLTSEMKASQLCDKQKTGPPQERPASNEDTTGTGKSDEADE